MEKKLDGNCTRMLRAILTKTWRKQPTRQQLYGHLPLIPKTIQIRRNRHARHCKKSKGELISVILMWTPSHGRAKAGRPVKKYTQQLCAYRGFSLEDLPGAMDDRDGWRERVRKISAGSVTWWWSWSLLVLRVLWYNGNCIILILGFMRV